MEAKTKGMAVVDVNVIPEVLRHAGDKMLIPATLPLTSALVAIENAIAYDDQTVAINERIDGSFWDAAHAMYIAMCQEFGWVFQKATPTMFGPQPPQMTSIAIGYDSKGRMQRIQVPTGRFSLPDVEGYVQTGTSMDSNTGLVHFALTGVVKRKYEPQIKRIAEAAREYLKVNSLYKSKAVRLRFTNDDGENIELPQPEFMDVRKNDPKGLILNDDVYAAVETNIFTPIVRTDECRAAGIPLKRGVLLGGAYGTGKTLTAHATAHLCERNGWTFIYCEKTDELAQTVRFAMQYAPAVIFCEDIDRTMNGERTLEMDDVLNIVDGIESKNSEIMIVVTSNHMDDINPAMLRPGRLDAVIEFQLPDAKAAGRLVEYYGRGLIHPKVDLFTVGKALAGNIPAVIRECVERAKLSEIKVGQHGKTFTVSEAALLDAANSMKMQTAMLNRAKPLPTPREKLIDALGEFLLERSGGTAAQQEIARETHEMVERIKDHIDA